MLYTKMKPTSNNQNNPNDEEKKQSDIQAEYAESQSSILQYYCKNCNYITDEYSTELRDTNICIYKRNYQEDYIVERVISNKYTIYDNTLPRVTYDCINVNCPTNIKTELQMGEYEKFYVMIDNLPPDYTNEQIELIFSNDMDRIESTYRVKLTKYIVKLKLEMDRPYFEQAYNNKDIDTYKLKVVPYEKPKKEVIYIKYDNINMKYLYICANCGTSWKKN